VRIFLAAWLLPGVPVFANPLPSRMTECEQGVCTGDWRFAGKEGTAHWSNNGVDARLLIERFDASQVVIRRTDTGKTRGATVTYSGQIHGNQVQGSATYLWPGHWNNKPFIVPWSATLYETGLDQGSTGGFLHTGASGAPPIGQWRNPNGEPFHFDGRNTMRIDTPGLDLPNGSSWSLEAWVNPSVLVPAGSHVAGKRGPCGSGDGFYQLGIGHNAPGKGMGAELDTVRPHEWNHLVIAMNGNVGWTVYSNGSVTKSVSSPGWRIHNGGTFLIGGAGTCRPFEGDIQEVSLYDRELSASEVQALYRAGRTGQMTITASNSPPRIEPPQQSSQTPQAQPQQQAQAQPPPLQAQPQPQPQSQPQSQPQPQPHAEVPSPDDAWVPKKRLALIIGNSRYSQTGAASGAGVWPDLQEGPTKDADAVAARLRALGFDVTELKNLNIDQMTAALRAFADRIAGAPDALALFYFSGHGARAPRDLGDDGEETYLIPVDTNLQYDADAHTKAVGLLEIRNVMRRSRAGVVILDACRNNALRRPPTRAAGTRGLAAPNNVSGMLFAYSTSAGDVAENRPGEMSEYTELLVHEIGQPGQSLTGSFRKVRKQIAQLHQARLPELTDELNDDVVLVPR
jgi:hypothetical protein